MTDEARERISALGGVLYVWMTVHGCCTGALRLLETSGVRPEKAGVRFEPIDAGGVIVQVDARVRPSLNILVIEPGRRASVKAFWNDQAWVG